jgi:hypothetical protein
MPIPPPPAPPPKKDKRTGTTAVFQKYVNSHGLRQYSGLLWKWAKAYGVDPVYFAALIHFESGGNPNAKSSANAVGLAQIHLPTWVGKTMPWGEVVTAQKARDPAFALRFGAWYLARNVQKYGTYDSAYRHGYNPGYTGRGPFRDIPKGYTVTGGLTLEEKASVGAEGKVARQKAEGANPYLQGYAFQQQWHGNIDPIYEAYSGRPATQAEAREAIKNGWSAYHIQVMLSQRKSFVNSPVWKSNAPGYQAIYRSIYGNVRAPNMLVSYAIVHNLGSAFADTLRQGKGYVKSQEFKQNSASMANVYRKIFGDPDLHGMNVIDRVTAAGWTPDQFADYLRKQPDYTKSSEFRERAAGISAVFGNVQTLTAEQADATPELQGAPTDSRLPNYDGGQQEQAQKPPPKQKKKKKKAVPQVPPAKLPGDKNQP